LNYTRQQYFSNFLLPQWEEAFAAQAKVEGESFLFPSHCPPSPRGEGNH